MEGRRVNDELLKLILTKLHRLETHLNQFDNRLVTIELSMPPMAGSSSMAMASPALSSPSSRRCSCHIPQPVFQSFQMDWEHHTTASAYKASVDKLRSRFEFDDQSEKAPQDMSIGVASTCDGRSEVVDSFIDSYSVSVYPSRPVSNFGFHVNDSRRDDEIPEVPALRYEDMPQVEHALPRPSVSSRRASMASPIRTSTTRRGSAATAPQPRTFSRRKSSVSTIPTIERTATTRSSPASRASFSRVRGSIKRAASLRVPRRKSTTNGKGVGLDNADNINVASENIRASVMQQQKGEPFMQSAQKRAKAYASFVPRAISGFSRKMMNQQLRMLDVVA